MASKTQKQNPKAINYQGPLRSNVAVICSKPEPEELETQNKNTCWGLVW